MKTERIVLTETWVVLRGYDTTLLVFKAFTKRLRRAFDNLRYIATIETQSRGAYHFRLLVNVATLQDRLDFLAPCWHRSR